MLKKVKENLELERVNDIYANMFENEVKTLNDGEFKLLALLRMKSGQKLITWYKKDNLQSEVAFGKDKLNSTLNSLENKGAIIVFNCKDSKTNKQVSNIYYVCEYDEINKEYMTANSIEKIMKYALVKREDEEILYCVKNNKKPRTFKIDTRLNLEERKIKHVKKPSAENQTTEKNIEKPTTCFPTTDEPTTENKATLNNKISFKQLKSIKQLKNNNNEKNNVVVQEDLNLVKSYILGVAPSVSDKEVEMISKDILAAEKMLTSETLNIRFNAIKNYMGKNAVINIIGLIRKAIKEQWSVNTVNTKVVGSFNDYEQRTYDFDSLEKKLLGWDNEQEVAISI